MNNRRSHERFSLRLSAEIRLEGRRFTGTTRNLSVGGCCVESPHPVPDGAQLDVALFLVVDDIEEEAMPPLQTRGSVQWTAETDAGEHAVGLQFSSLTSAQQAWLTSFLARLDHA